MRNQLNLLAFTALSLAAASPALALDKIYSPNVDYREIAIEYSGSKNFDRNGDKDNAQKHEFEIEAGIMPRWTAGISSGFKKEPNGKLKSDAIEIENRFQFFEPGQYWLDAGLLASYEFTTQHNTADVLETKLLLQKDIGKFTSTMNIGLEHGVGEHSDHTGGAEYGFLSNTRYRYSEEFQPGIEIQSELGHNKDLNNLNDQEHYVGPAVYGKLFGNIKYQAAYLAGVSPNAADSAARLTVEYEMHF